MRPHAEAKQTTGKPPISVRWVDTNKGDDDNPDYRSRLVAKEIKTYRDNMLFAATPPWEAIETLLSLAVTQGHGLTHHARDGKCIDHIDIRRAYFHAPAKRQVFVELPKRGRHTRHVW